MSIKSSVSLFSGRENNVSTPTCLGLKGTVIVVRENNVRAMNYCSIMFPYNNHRLNHQLIKVSYNQTCVMI
jgi:hypothetical protein